MPRSGIGYELIVVEDSSPDGTMSVALRLQKVFAGKIRILQRAGKQGLGTAYIQALEYARGDYIVLMDADLSHHVSACLAVDVRAGS
jgi:dolichol-phosphate mannosyltransferase